MLSDAIVSVRCPGCSCTMDPTCLKAVIEEGQGLCEHYTCPGCGCRFRVAVSLSLG